MRPLEHAEYARGIKSAAPSRCTAMEGRWLNERDPLRKHWAVVQCGLKRHVEKVPHEHQGRKFNTPSKKQVPSRKDNRCTATEDREVTGGKTVNVRCSGKKKHREPHAFRRRDFGMPLAKKKSGTYYSALRRRADERDRGLYDRVA